MTSSRNKIEGIGFVFLVSIILFSLIYVKSNIDIAFSQTISLSTSAQVKDSTYVAIPSLGDRQSKVYESTLEDHILKNTSLISNPLSNNPTYSITNATTSIKTGILNGLNSNKVVLDNQTMILPQENVIVGNR
ncbi:MAG: hypothetical protein L0H53_01965 [Candidatus Nitrosocosmicus sp.]|nr:hypothetical protein [Candidatus Nitrosocosmicus sp.]MDN5866422.1 hypothetical protein [Candidatus Nitrosocosmicus sp.]